jgi:hypothetical protein
VAEAAIRIKPRQAEIVRSRLDQRPDARKARNTAKEIRATPEKNA